MGCLFRRNRLLASLPEGLQTRLGRKSWDGKGLSGGQWQTVANARAADLIVVLDGGRVVEVGTHDTLSQADGLYAELFRLQARYFV
jgi:ATP-binding cassette, subfamily B, bacterial